MKPWHPEFEVTSELATSLLVEQFPELLPVEVQSFDSGWDNVVYLVNQRWLFRFPQRQIAVDGVAREMACMETIRAAISVVPKIAFWGKPSSAYDWPFFGYEPVSGKESGEVRLSKQARSDLGQRLGAVLSKLHGRELFESLKDKLPVDPLGRLDFSNKIPQTESRLKDLESSKVKLPYDELLRALRAATEVPRLEPTSVVHGDLHFRHLIVAQSGELSGIIDWGDLHLNDPSVDLHLYWGFLPPDARSRFAKAYGPISKEQLIIARAFAVFVNVALLHYALDTDRALVKEEALFALENLLLD